MFDVKQLFFIIVLLAVGSLILFLRRRAGGSKSLYKLILIGVGFVLATATLGGKNIIYFDSLVLRNLSMLLIVAITFELSMRLTPENIAFKHKSILLIAILFAANLFIVGLLSAFVLYLSALHAIILSLVMCAVEYFFIDELRQEGDLSSPLLVFFIFSLVYVNSAQENFAGGIWLLLQYILIAAATGILVGIILLKSMKKRGITWVHELGLLSAALVTYIGTNLLGGSGILSVIILGIFFGNSFVKKRSEMKTFSPSIYKTLEILMFILVGFYISLDITIDLVWKSIVIFAVYVIVRLGVLSIFYRQYSLQNRMLLTLAPKGIMYSGIMLVLAGWQIVSQTLLNVMFLILLISLIITTILENIEERKIHKLDRIFHALKHIRYGRKHKSHGSPSPHHIYK